MNKVSTKIKLFYGLGLPL